MNKSNKAGVTAGAGAAGNTVQGARDSEQIDTGSN